MVPQRMLLATWIAIAFNLMVQADDQATAEGLADQVRSIFRQHCVDCHNDAEREAELSLETFRSIKDSAAIRPGDASESELFKRISGTSEPLMPPEDRSPLSPEQIDLIRKWIDSGAKGIDVEIPLMERLRIPQIASRFSGKLPITAGTLTDAKTAVIGQFGEVVGYALDVEPPKRLWSLAIAGKINQLRLAKPSTLVVASGVSGLGGQVSLVDLNSREIVLQLDVPSEAVFTACLSPDGRWLATGAYDRRIRIWNMEERTWAKVLEGHNGAILDLDFDPQSQLLASASADETIKIWHVATGSRLDTLNQGEAEQTSVRFLPDGSAVIGGGADRRIRKWKLVSRTEPAINPLTNVAFAHEGGVLGIELNADGTLLTSFGRDQQIKLWSTSDLRPLGVAASTEDTPSWSGLMEDSVAFGTLKGEMIVASRPTQLQNSSDSNASRRPRYQPRFEESPESRIAEVEPNNDPKVAQFLSLPTTVSGSIELRQDGLADEDWFSFDAQEGERWLLAVQAARDGSPLDSVLEVTDDAGTPVLRTRLQAVRESYFTFRGKNSDTSDDFRLHKWEDMELNEYLYANGEVTKLWLYPRGPDSGFKVYPGFGRRYTYFDTTPLAHALGEPAWIVRELQSDESPIPNGLPVFSIYFENDDDSRRLWGKDSRLYFDAPYSGRFFIRLRDAAGNGGEAYRYQLSVQRPVPTFTIAHNAGDALTVAPGTGREFEISLERHHGLEGPIDIQFDGVPEAVIVTPSLYVESGQNRAQATIFLPHDAEQIPETFELRLTARAKVGDQVIEVPVEKPILVKKTADERVEVWVTFPDGLAPTIEHPLRIRPGQTIRAIVHLNRKSMKSDLGFGNEDCGRNLPHGVFVDNIGLNGLLVPAAQDQQEFFIYASPIATPQRTWFHLRANTDGAPTSAPIPIVIEE